MWFCGLAELCYSWPHLALFLYECLNKIISFTIPLSYCTCLSFNTAYPTLQKYIPYSVMSPWQYRRQFLALMYGECITITTRLRLEFLTVLDRKQIICSDVSVFILLHSFPNNRSILWPWTNETAWVQYMRQFVIDCVCVLFMRWGLERTFFLVFKHHVAFIRPSYTEEESYIQKNNYNTQRTMNQVATLEIPVTGIWTGLVWTGGRRP
jgi:hypothetical protein